MMPETKTENSILSIKQVLDIECLMEQPKTLMHSLWLRNGNIPMLDIEDGKIKSVPDFTGQAVPKLSEAMMVKMHKAEYVDSTGALLKLGNRMLIAQAMLNWFSQNHWHNRFEWHPIKPYSLKDLECGIDPARQGLKKVSLESGLWTNGKIAFKMSDAELDRLRIAWKTHIASIEHFVNIKPMLNTKGKALHVAHLEAVRSTHDGDVWYLIRSDKVDEYAVVNAVHFETIMLRFPKAKLFVEDRNAIVRFFVGINPVGLVVPIRREENEDPVVDINSMLED